MSATTKKYISVNPEDNTTEDTIIMKSLDNEISGTLKTKDKDSDTEATDIRDIFIKKDALENIEEIDVSEDADPGFNIETIANRFNQMLNALKGTAPLILFLCGAGVVFGADTDGKAKLRYIGANQYVVTNEVDGVFKLWKDDEYNTWKTNVDERLNAIDDWKTNVVDWQTVVDTWKSNIDDWRTNSTFSLG